MGPNSAACSGVTSQKGDELAAMLNEDITFSFFFAPNTHLIMEFSTRVYLRSAGRINALIASYFHPSNISPRDEKNMKQLHLRACEVRLIPGQRQGRAKRIALIPSGKRRFEGDLRVVQAPRDEAGRVTQLHFGVQQQSPRCRGLSTHGTARGGSSREEVQAYSYRS